MANASELFGNFFLRIRVTDVEIVDCPSPQAIPLELLSNRTLRLILIILENLKMWKSPYREIFASQHRRGTTILSANMRKLSNLTQGPVGELNLPFAALSLPRHGTVDIMEPSSWLQNMQKSEQIL